MVIENGIDNQKNVAEGDNVNGVVAAAQPHVGPATYDFTFAWEDLLTDEARDDLMVFARRQKGMWVVENGQFRATFLPYEQALQRARELELAATVKKLTAEDPKGYNPRKEVILLFMEPIDIAVGSPATKKKVRTLAISRGKNTVSRTEMD